VGDKSTQLIVEALTGAVADPAGVPLFGNKGKPGLFPWTLPARQAAQRCKDENYIRVIGSEKRGKSDVELCAITQTGLAYLLNQVSPRQVLGELVQALQAREEQVGSLVAEVQKTQANLDQLRAVVEQVLQSLASSPPTMPTNGASKHLNGSANADAWIEDAMKCLVRWHETHATEDCSLPELYRQVREEVVHLTVGEFHDGLRTLHDQGRIYLHPWTGPLYDIPDPSLVLMVGHELAYYVSIRR
jgi:hypothetical protein